jgi:hypothetical protein
MRRAATENLSGRRVRLVSTNDPYTRLRPGSEGTVFLLQEDVFERGKRVLHVDWDDGSSLSLLEATGDRWEVLP